MEQETDKVNLACACFILGMIYPSPVSVNPADFVSVIKMFQPSVSRENLESSRNFKPAGVLASLALNNSLILSAINQLTSYSSYPVFESGDNKLRADYWRETFLKAIALKENLNV